MRPRSAGVLVLALLVLASACGQPRSAVIGSQVSGCAEALRERAAATSAIDAAEKQAVERSGGRLAELQSIASDGKQAILSVADVGLCEDQSGARGVAVDLADLRARYRVVVERTTAQLDEMASRPAPAVQPQRGRNDDKGKPKGN